MSDKSTTFPFEDLIAENSVTITELPAKTQTLITKFKAETDEDKKEAFDVSIYGQIEDYLEAKEAKEKEEKTKTKIAAHKAKKIDVSKADTATGKDGKTKSDQEPPKKEKGILDRLFKR